MSNFVPARNTSPAPTGRRSWENQFALLFAQKAPEIKLTGKVVAGSTNQEVLTSVDQSFEHDGVRYLVEIDSGNVAKTLVGQYVLLNELLDRKDRAIQHFFLVVHTYNKYNPERTLRNLRLVNERLYKGDGIPFGAIHQNAVTNWSGGIAEFIHMARPTRNLVE